MSKAERKEQAHLRAEHRAEVALAKAAALTEKRRIAALSNDANTRIRMERSERLRIERNLRNRSGRTQKEKHEARVRAGLKARATFEARLASK